MPVFNPLSPNHYAYRGAVQPYATFYAADGVTLVDPTTVNLRVRNPATGITTVYTYGGGDGVVQRVSTGQYQVDAGHLFTIAGIGAWAYEWDGTGLNRAAGEGYFEVDPTAFP